MCKKLYLLIIFTVLSHEVVFGKNGSHTKNIKNINKKPDKKSGKVNNERGKRSLGEFEKTFLAHVEPQSEEQISHDLARFASEGNLHKIGEKDLEHEPPFWGTRGRRDSSSASIEYDESSKKPENKNMKCNSCFKDYQDFQSNKIREKLDPFWFENGVKSSDELMRDVDPFWGNRGTRSKIKWKSQVDDPPFWGNRGRRDEIEPFWGNRGRRDETEPFWGNRGRRDEKEPFWGNRGRRDEVEPFWGNRGRRQENEPFWGTRGRRQTENHVRRNSDKKKVNDLWAVEQSYPYWGNQERKKTTLKENIINAMDNIEYGIENLARMRRMDENSFWNNRGRESKLENLFNEIARNRNPFQSDRVLASKAGKKLSEPNTVLDERMYAEQPHYILIERSSRSSGEEDPFFISRGKKYTTSKISKGIRGRRGVLEDLVKSVRNDPYYIARGKKDVPSIKNENSTSSNDEFLKAKELICSAVDLLLMKNDGHKVKRDTDESERDRRTILKKLAAELQMDPYFVSRGKRTGDTEDRLEEFINHISNMCN